MRLEYDEQVDAAYLWLDEQGVIVDGKSVVVDHGLPDTAVICQFDSEDRLVGIKFLGARRLLPGDCCGKQHRLDVDVRAVRRRDGRPPPSRDAHSASSGGAR